MKHVRYALAALLVAVLATIVVMPIQVSGQAKAKDTIIMSKGKNPMGGVKFEHKKHSELADVKCDTCHHAAKLDIALKAPQQACSDCHVTPPKAPMKVNYQGAFHKPTGQAGTCIDCHKTSNAKGSKAPVKCTDCHKKENKAG